MRTQGEDIIANWGVGAPDTGSALSPGASQAPDLGERNVCHLSHPAYVTSVIAAQTKAVCALFSQTNPTPVRVSK